MAHATCLFSFSLTHLPLRTPNQEFRLMNSGLCSVSSPVAHRKDNMRPPCLLFDCYRQQQRNRIPFQMSPAEAKNIKGVRHAASRTRSDSNCLSMPSGLLCTLFYDSITGFSGIHSTISGYWIGPDVEDGWGYVEASISQIFHN